MAANLCQNFFFINIIMVSGVEMDVTHWKCIMQTNNVPTTARPVNRVEVWAKITVTRKKMCVLAPTDRLTGRVICFIPKTQYFVLTLQYISS